MNIQSAFKLFKIFDMQEVDLAKFDKEFSK
jgi:hypothetical protein